MADKQRYAVTQVIAAIQAADGLLTEAARRLGCSRQTVYKYAEKHPDVAQAIEEAREILLGTAECELVKHIRGGNLTAIIFFLKCHGKSRGYIERPRLVSPTPEAAEPEVDTSEVLVIDVGANGHGAHG